jgi:hypothetical protein
MSCHQPRLWYGVLLGGLVRNGSNGSKECIRIHRPDIIREREAAFGGSVQALGYTDAGAMFAFRWKVLSGSQRVFNATRRSNFVAP